jgi:ABC-type nitrate/sulfonate/bicarbonate transport system substrate-binding protein
LRFLPNSAARSYSTEEEMRIKYFSFAAIAVALVAASAPAAADPEHVTLNFGMTRASMSLFQSIPLRVAVEKGMLAREGITLEFVMLGGVTENVEALNKGTADIALTATNDLVTAVMNGSKAVAVVGGPANTIYSVVSKPGIATFDDLKGKPIAVSLPGDIISIATKLILGMHGFTDKEYVPKVSISSALREKCLEMEDCAAAALAQPFDVNMTKKGYHLLATSHDVISDLQYTVYAVLPSWGQAHRGILVSFARAMGEAYKYTNDPAHRDEIVSIGVATTGASQDVVTELYDMYFKQYAGVLPKHGEINVAGVVKVIELMEAAGVLKGPAPRAGSLIDLQYLEAAGLQ